MDKSSLLMKLSKSAVLQDVKGILMNLYGFFFDITL